jgi:uncharacterized membrane protein YgcG
MRRHLVLFALLLALPRPLQAERSLVIERFHADVAVAADGQVVVTETIEPRFTGTWNGIFRNIPVEYRTPQGLNYTLLLDVERVTDGEGRELRYERSRERHYRKLKIWVPDATDTVRTVVLRYRVRNGLKFFEQHDELYWNVTGDEWEVPIEAASARVTLPAQVTGIRAAAFTGGYGSAERAATVETAAAEVRVQTTRRLSFREGLTVAVAWNAGVIPRPGPADRAALFLRSNWILLLPLLALAVMWRLWHARGRDPRRRPIAPRYEPPAGLTPAEVGTLVDHSPDMRDITATLVDLAVRGFVVIEEVKTEQLFGLWTSTDYVFTLKRNDREGLRGHERALLDAMFGGRAPAAGARVEMSDLKNKFYKHLPDIRGRIFDRLVAQRTYVQRPDRVKRRYLIAGAIAGAAIAWGGMMIGDRFGVAPGSAILAGILTALVVCGFGLLMPARTVHGARTLEEALGFSEFLERVESDRFERVVKTPQLFERYLPFAMALGVHETWAKAFEDTYRQPPEWYRGTGHAAFRPGVFVGDLNRMSAAAATAMASAPRSSGGSGVGGGGFSGGGFGGGGGGGF